MAKRGLPKTEHVQLMPTLQAGSEFGKFCFSHDSKFLFCCCGYVVKVFNTANGELLHDLKGHTKVVTGVSVNPSNVLQVVSCAQDGLLIFWDYLDGVKLKQYDLRLPLFGIVSFNAEKKSVMLIAQTLEHSGKRYSLMQWKWKKSNPSKLAAPKMLIDKCNADHRLVAFGCMKEYVASGLGAQLTIHSMKKQTTQYVSDPDKYNKGKAITCVACHPNEYCIATGLENGRILFWYNFFRDGQPAISMVHWHALPVQCLSYTTDGANLLSGGHECVLVRWQTANTNQRDFKPRMGAPLCQVLASPDGSLYATGHSDNVIQLLDINLKVRQVYRGLARGNLGRKDGRNPVPAGLTFDPRSRTIITNGLPGHLQFYSLALNKQLYNVDIVGQNYISAEVMERPKVVTEVTSVAVSQDGIWMATFEAWDDGFFSPELRLKFWEYKSEARMYVLNTTVEYPHDNKVVSLTFRPALPGSVSGRGTPCVVSVGWDRCFKLWSLVDDTDIYRSNTRWHCDSVGFYRDLKARCADFSADGSALAVGFEHLLTLWDPDNNAVRTTLSNCLAGREKVKCVKFGLGQCQHSLAVTTHEHLLVWDLLTLTVQWSLPMATTCLITDPSSHLMACISKDKTLRVFSPKDSNAVYEHQQVTSSAVRDAVFVPDARPPGLVDIGWPGHSQLFVYNSEDELLTLDAAGQAEESQRVRVAQNVPKSALSVMIAEKRVHEESGEMKETSGQAKDLDESMLSFLGSNEPLSLSCDNYLNSLLVKRKRKQNSLHDSHAEDESKVVSDSSSSESDMEEEEEELSRDQLRLMEQKNCILLNQGREETDMDKLMNTTAHWRQWCASLCLK